MKTGDKVICIKTFKLYDKGSQLYLKGQIYTITDSGEGPHPEFIRLMMKKNKEYIPDFFYYYTIKSNNNGEYHFIDKDIDEYFISLKKYRKQKLNKIILKICH